MMKNLRKNLICATLLLMASTWVQAESLNLEQAAKIRGKPAAPVNIQVDGEKSYQSGQLIELTVQILPLSDINTVKISLKPTVGLSIVGEREFMVSSPDRGQKISIPAQLVANGDGLHRFRVVVQTEQHGKLRARTLSVPIQVGPINPVQKTAPLVATPDGEMLREVRISEEVNPEL